MARTAATIAVMAGAVTMLGAPAASAGTLAGPAQVVKSDFVTPLSSGGSGTNFSLRLPAQSRCSGDTANQGFNVNSFIIPASVDPGTLTYDANGPTAPGSFPLIDSSGTPYVAQTTAPNTGQIYPTGPPLFNYSIFDTTQLVPGQTYKIGIACATKTGATDVYFVRTINIIASASDPKGFTWSVVPPNDIPESPLAIALPLSALLVGGLGAVYLVRRKRSEGAVAV